MKIWLQTLGAMLTLVTAQAFALTTTHSVYLDTDADSSTGCTVVTGAGDVTGAEVRISATVDGSPPVVLSVSRAACAGGVFVDAPQAPAGQAVGLNLGTDGSDVVEFSTALAGLGAGGPVSAVFVSSDGASADLARASVVLPAAVPGGGQGQGGAVPVPGLGGFALLLLAGLIIWRVWRHPGMGATLIVIVMVGSMGGAWAANFVSDGQIQDWSGVAAVAPSPVTGEGAGADLRGAFVASEGGRLYFRMDVRNLGNPGDPAASTKMIYASPSGAGTACSQSAPCSLIGAQQMVRQQRASGVVDLVVQLAGGTYRLANTWTFGEADSGTKDHPVVWMAAPGARAVIAGSTQVSGWAQVDQVNNIWAASVPANSRTRQLYVAGNAVPVAQRTPEELGFKGAWKGSATGYDISADTVAVAWFAKLDAQQVSEVEFDYPGSNGDWAHSRCRVASYSAGNLVMAQPCWTNVTGRAAFSQSSGSLPSMPVNKLPTSLQNAKALMQTGQWFLDTAQSTLYYRVVPGQPFGDLNVELPRLEALVQGVGTLAKPLHDVTFKGLEFSYATWNDPSTNVGFADVQSNLRITGANNQGLCNFSSPAGSCPWGSLSQPLANVSFAASNNITLQNNRFVNLGGAGLSFMYGSSNNLVDGNEFTAIASTGILLGCTYDPTPGTTDAAAIKKNCHPDATLVADDLIDAREIMTGNTISNNVIHRIGTDYTSACGITLLFSRKTKITQNHIYDVPYTAITAGVIQGHVNDSTHPNNALNINADNTISNNLLHDYMQVRSDGGAIYIEGHQAQYYYKADGVTIDPVATLAHGIQVSGNVAFNGHNSNFTFYDDAGSEWINWSGNVAFNGGTSSQGGCNPTGHIWYTGNYVSGTTRYGCKNQQIDINASDNTKISSTPQPGDIPANLLSQAGLTSAYQALGAATAGMAYAVSSATAATPFVAVGGGGFLSRPDVFFDGVKSPSVQYVSDGLLFATVPGGSRPGKVTVGNFPVPPKITSPVGNDSNPATSNVLAGTGVPGHTVTVTDGSASICMALVATDTKWTCSDRLANGSYTLVATQSKAPGMASAASEVVTIYVGTVPYGRVNDDHLAIAYTGWSLDSNRSTRGIQGDLNNDIHYATGNGSSLTMTFDGTVIQVFGETNTDQGTIGISIDGGVQQTASNLSTDGLRHTNVLLYTSPTLTPGRHTISVVKLSGKFATFDGFNITP